MLSLYAESSLRHAQATGLMLHWQFAQGDAVEADAARRDAMGAFRRWLEDGRSAR